MDRNWRGCPAERSHVAALAKRSDMRYSDNDVSSLTLGYHHTRKHMHTEQGGACVVAAEAPTYRIDAAQHLGLARIAVNRYRRWAMQKGIDLADLEGEAYLHLVRVARRFPPGKGVRWSTYAIPRIQSHLRNKIIAWRPLPQANLKGGDGNILDPLNAASDEGVEADERRRRAAEEVPRLLPCLTPRLRKVLTLYFGLDDGTPHKLSEVAERFGITHQRASQLLARGLRRLRQEALSRG
jgi:RNA polymerase sigma factor (sigma-70 family)